MLISVLVSTLNWTPAMLRLGAAVAVAVISTALPDTVAFAAGAVMFTTGGGVTDARLYVKLTGTKL